MIKNFTKISMLFIAMLVSLETFSQPWTDGQPASNVLGQPFFNTRTPGTSPTSMDLPTQVIVDPVTGKLFVADNLNNRVLRFPASASTTDGAAAEAVLGQPNLTSNGSGQSATTMSNPISIAMDAGGSLWVADYLNNRVLRFDNAASIPSGSPANGVLGQTNFTATLPSLTQSGFFNPISVFISGTTLWVTDYNNNRILRFDNAAAKANGGNADGVLGEPDFNTALIGTAINRINSPAQVFVDAAGTLWLADMGNNRVIRFNNAATLPNGANASGELGQVNFNTVASGTTASNFNHPFGVTGDPGGRIYVSDLFNNRVLIFNNAANIPDGSPATNVLGQPNFTSGANNVTITTMYWPYFLFLDTKLYVAEEGNYRITSFTPFSSLLPVRLTSFTASVLPGTAQALVQWQSQGDNPGDSYELQYSTDGIHFAQTISTQWVKSNGNNDYSYTHTVAAQRNNFYRLKMINADGHFSFSNIVELSSRNAEIVNLFPNPARDNVTIGLHSANTAVISIFDNEGRLVKTATVAATSYVMDVHLLSAGIYTVSIVQDNKTISVKLVKK